MTAVVTDDYTAIPTNTRVTFAEGSEVEEYSIALLEDSIVEGIEYFQVSIATVGGANAVDGSIDMALNTANVFVLDLSSKYKNEFGMRFMG